MAKEESVRIRGTVTESLPNTSFRVTTEEGNKILAHVSGKMRKYYIKVLPGDAVDVEVSPYDPTKGRIVFRHK